MTQLDGELARRRANLAIVAGHGDFLEERANYYSSWAAASRIEYEARLSGELDWLLKERRQRICYRLNDHRQVGIEQSDARFGLYKSDGRVGLLEMSLEHRSDFVGDIRRHTENKKTTIVSVDLSQITTRHTQKARFFCPDHLRGRLIPGRNTGVVYTAPIEDRSGVLVVVPEDMEPYELKTEITHPEYSEDLYKYLGLLG